MRPCPPLRRAVPALLAVGLVLGACSSPGADPEPDAEAPSEAPDDAPEPLTARTPLTGELVEDEVAAELDERPLLIAKVENSAAARPQAGLDAADVVVEELVEGGVTRFMALFHSELPDAVGPVRSARPVDVQLGAGFGRPVFAYSGARAQVQSLLAGSTMVALEEGAPGFARVPDRRAPHDLFLTPAEVLAAGVERGAGPLVEPGWTFAEEAPAGAETCPEDDASCTDPGASLTVAMSHSARTGWTYDDEAAVYRRDQDGQASTVTGEGRIGAANVVVLGTRHFTEGCCDTNGAPYTETEVVGEGEAVFLRDGQRYAGRWRKADVGAPLELLGPDGSPFPLAPGPSWVLLPSRDVLAAL